MNRSTRPPSRATTFVGVAPDSLEWDVAAESSVAQPTILQIGRMLDGSAGGSLPPLPRLVLTALWLLVSGHGTEAGGATDPRWGIAFHFRALCAHIQEVAPAEVLAAVGYLASVGMLTVCSSQVAAVGTAPRMTLTLNASFLGDNSPLVDDDDDDDESPSSADPEAIV